MSNGRPQVVNSVPPQNLDAEESVLGAMMIDRRAIEVVAETVRPEDFYRESHAIIFRTAIELAAAGEAVDAITLADALDARQTRSGQNALEAVGGKVRIQELAATVPATANAGHYARIIRDNAVLRGLIRAGSELARLGWERPGEIDDLIAKAEGIVSGITATQNGTTTALHDDLEALVEGIRTAYESGTGRLGLQTHFIDLDRLTTGFHPGQLILVAGRPAMGKSLLSQNIAENVADHGTPSAIFSYEMSREEIVLRSLSRSSGIDSQRLRTGIVTDNQWPRIDKGREAIESRPLYADDRSLGLHQLRAEARRLQRQHNVGLIVVDYLQLMIAGDDEETRTNQIAAISRSLKLLAREMKIPVVAVSQLNRAVEFRKDKRPILSDLRDSGAIEQDADVVMFVYRDEYYNPRSDQLGIAEVNIAKQRMGPTGTVRLAYIAGKSTFANLATEGTS